MFLNEDLAIEMMTDEERNNPELFMSMAEELCISKEVTHVR